MVSIEAKDGSGDYWLNNKLELVAVEFQEGALIKGIRSMRIEELNSTIKIKINDLKVSVEIIKNNEKISEIFKRNLCNAICFEKTRLKITDQEFSDIIGVDIIFLNKIINHQNKEITLEAILRIVEIINEKTGGLQNIINAINELFKDKA